MRTLNEPLLMKPDGVVVHAKSWRYSWSSPPASGRPTDRVVVPISEALSFLALEEKNCAIIFFIAARWLDNGDFCGRSCFECGCAIGEVSSG